MTYEDKLHLWLDKDATQYEVDKRYALSRYKFGYDIVKYFPTKLKNKKILDVSVGTGGIACAFSEAGALVHGLDVKKYFIEISKQRFKDMKLKFQEIKLWNGNRIPYHNKFFDVVICTDTMEHVPDYELLSSEISRVLKKDGLLFFTTECRFFPLFILWNPHDGIPFTILMPRFIRKFIDEKILSKPCLDYHWFSSFTEVKNLFKKYNIYMKKFDYLKKESFNKLKKKYRLPEFLRGFYNLMMIHCLGAKK